jgi:hypothetical protein
MNFEPITKSTGYKKSPNRGFYSQSRLNYDLINFSAFFLIMSRSAVIDGSL